MKAALLGAGILLATALVVIAIGGWWPRQRAKARGRHTTKLSGLKAIGTMWGDAVRAVLRRRRSASVAADATARRRELARAAVRAGTTVGGTRFRSLFVGRERRTRMREGASRRAAVDLAATMADMRGLAMKMGQMGSYIMGLSGSAEHELARLQNDIPPMAFERIARVLEEDLGSEVMAEFEEFAETPLAAASIGQVHAARLRDGRDVVVKVQYPGIREAVVADLENLDMMYQVMTLTGGGDLGRVIDDLARALREEVDYEREAANQQHFADLYRDHAFVKIPAVVRELSSGRVLTSERVDGRRLYEILDRPQHERDWFGEIIYRFAFGSIFAGVFSGDPHPGNYLFMEDGRVCFLDFGFVGRLDARALPIVQAPIAAALQHDYEGLARALQGIGLMPERGRVRPDRLWAETAPLLIGPIDEDRAVVLDPESFAAAFRRTQKITAEMSKARKSTNLPAWITILMRYSMGSLAVLAKLRCQGNWHRLARELVLGDPPTTDMGRAWEASLGGERDRTGVLTSAVACLQSKEDQ